MAHITLSGLLNARTYHSYTLGLTWLLAETPSYRSLNRHIEILDARYAGTLTIPEQQGTSQNPDNELDNDELGQLDPITWIEDMAAGSNTSEFALAEPTIDIDDSNYFAIQGNPTIENNRLKLSITKTGSPTAAKPGLYVKMGDTIPRIYKITQASNTIWYLAPPRLPFSTGNPKEADRLRFQVQNPNDLLQYRDYRTRGPYQIKYMESNT